MLDTQSAFAHHFAMNAIRTLAARSAASIAEWLRPDLSRRIAAGDARAASGRIGRMILRAQARRAARAGDWSSLAARLAAYWRSGEGDRFYDAYADRFDRWFRDAHAPWVEALCSEIASGPYERLVEIGCGDGRALAHFAARLPSLETLTGIDLNASIIARNRARYADNPRLRFEAGDAAAWLAQHAAPGLVVAAYGGVLEYVQPDTIERLFEKLAARAAPVMVALVEPLDESFDLSRETRSRAGGLESSFSHPYTRMLERAGFAIRFAREVRIEHRWLMLIAARAPDQAQ
jgi:SAM-dependent methyltransferase